MKIQNNIPTYLKAIKNNPSMSSVIAKKSSKNSAEKLFEMVEKRSKNIDRMSYNIKVKLEEIHRKKIYEFEKALQQIGIDKESYLENVKEIVTQYNEINNKINYLEQGYNQFKNGEYDINKQYYNVNENGEYVYGDDPLSKFLEEGLHGIEKLYDIKDMLERNYTKITAGFLSYTKATNNVFEKGFSNFINTDSINLLTLIPEDCYVKEGDENFGENLNKAVKNLEENVKTTKKAIEIILEDGEYKKGKKIDINKIKELLMMEEEIDSEAEKKVLKKMLDTYA